jgi:hypothetical protein
MTMDTRQLVKGRIAEALVEAVLLDSDYRIVRAGRESQVQATLECADRGRSADFVIWRRVGATSSGRPLHDVVVMEVKYRGELETWLRHICETLIRDRGQRRSELHVVLVTDRPDPGRSCFQLLRLGAYVPGERPVTLDLHEADLGIHRATVDKYEPFVRAMFEAVRSMERKPAAKLSGRGPLVADQSRGASLG